MGAASSASKSNSSRGDGKRKGKGKQSFKAEREALVELGDADRDGKLTVDEFVAAMRKLATRHDVEQTHPRQRRPH